RSETWNMGWDPAGPGDSASRPYSPLWSMFPARFLPLTSYFPLLTSHFSLLTSHTLSVLSSRAAALLVRRGFRSDGRDAGARRLRRRGFGGVAGTVRARGGSPFRVRALRGAREPRVASGRGPRRTP